MRPLVGEQHGVGGEERREAAGERHRREQHRGQAEDEAEQRRHRDEHEADVLRIRVVVPVLARHQRVDGPAADLSGLEVQQEHVDQPLGERLRGEDEGGNEEVPPAPAPDEDPPGQVSSNRVAMTWGERQPAKVRTAAPSDSVESSPPTTKGIMPDRRRAEPAYRWNVW